MRGVLYYNETRVYDKLMPVDSSYLVLQQRELHSSHSRMDSIITQARAARHGNRQKSSQFPSDKFWKICHRQIHAGAHPTAMSPATILMHAMQERLSSASIHVPEETDFVHSPIPRGQTRGRQGTPEAACASPRAAGPRTCKQCHKVSMTLTDIL